MFDVIKFIYNLIGQAAPSEADLNNEIDRLLFVKGAEEANYLANPDELPNTTTMDAEVLSHWLRRRFEPALMLLLLGVEDNFHLVNSELLKMNGYKSWVDRFLRFRCSERFGLRRIKGLCFDNPNNATIQRAVDRLKRSMTFLSNHLKDHSPENLTLQNTQAYTSADVTLYKYLKRIIVGQYKDYGLKSHLKMNDYLIKFMKRYAAKNTHVIDLTEGDPLSQDESSHQGLAADFSKPALVVMAFLFFYWWRKDAVGSPSSHAEN